MASGSSPSNLVNLIPDRLALNCGLQSEIFVLDQILESLGAEILRLDFTQFFEFSPDIQSNLHKIHQFCDDLAIRLSRKGPGLLVFSVPAKHYIQASFIFAAFMTLYFDWTIAEAKRMFPHLNLNEPSQSSIFFPYFVSMRRHVRHRSCLALLASCQSPITNALIAGAHLKAGGALAQGSGPVSYPDGAPTRFRQLRTETPSDSFGADFNFDR